jgi:hypothetical protein
MAHPFDRLDSARGDPCADCSHTTILATYPAPQGRAGAEGGSIPLRCGRRDVGRKDGWGYRHFAFRWTGHPEAFGADLAVTLRAGHRERVDRATVRYEHIWIRPDGTVDRAMTVVVSLRAQQPDGGIRGIITAYWWDRPERARRLGRARTALG